MKNYKLDVVRYNNEDVIATSGGIVTGPACERTDTIYKFIEKDPSHYFPGLSPNVQDADKFMYWYCNGNADDYEYQDTDFEPCDDSNVYGH